MGGRKALHPYSVGQHWITPALCDLPKNRNRSRVVFQSPRLFLTLSLDPQLSNKDRE